MELTIEERRMSGMRYYTIHPRLPEMYYQVQQTWNDMVEWCVNTYGPSPTDGIWTPGARWYVNNSKFWFREQKDLEWFVLKWQ